MLFRSDSPSGWSRKRGQVKRVMKMVEIGVLKEVTGQARNRLFAYTGYLAILAVGTEPLRRA